MAEERYATRQVVRMNGKPHVIFVDTEDGTPLTDLTGYTLIEQGDDLDIPSHKKKSSSEKKPEASGGEEELRRGGGSDRVTDGYQASEGSSNRFGYISKPSWLGYLSALPGPIGLMGKAVNATINATNVQAVNKARSLIGVPELTTFEMAKGIAKDRKGYIGDVVIGDQQYAIGFEAMTPDNRTTLTPDEARQRAVLSGSARLATKQEVEQAENRQAVLDAAKTKGLLSGMKGAGTRMLDEVLNRAPREFPPAPNPPSTPANAYAPTGHPVGNIPGQGLGGVRQITPGAGLANLAPNGIRSELAGKGRGAVPNADLVRAADMAVKTALGPGYSVSMISGTYDPARQARIDAKMAELNAAGISPESARGKAELRGAGQIGSTRHSHGQALDMDIIDPNGNRVTDQKALDTVAAEFGRQGISSMGHGKGYMGQGRFHVDTHGNKHSTWGGMPSSMEQGFLKERTEVGVLPFDGVPTPTSPEQAIAQDVQGHLGLAGYAPEARTPNALTAIENVLNGQSAPTKSQEDLEMISKTIAGELGARTINGILSGDQRAITEARQEIAAIASTIENRAKSTQYAGLVNPYAEVLDPSQYNANSPANAAVTQQNYDLVGDFIKQSVVDYELGNLQSPVPNATHYTSSYTNPSWERFADTPTTVGEHRFSTVRNPATGQPEYQRALPEQGPVPNFRETLTGLLDGPEKSIAQAPTGSDRVGYGGGFSPAGTSPFGGASPSSAAGSAGSDRGGFSPSKSGGIHEGSLSNATGSGWGWESTAGLDGPGGTLSSKAGMNAAQGSFGGFSAGTLGGTASGAGTGFGSVGNGLSTVDTHFDKNNQPSGGFMKEGVLGAGGGFTPVDLPGKNLGIQAPTIGPQSFTTTIESPMMSHGFGTGFSLDTLSDVVTKEMSGIAGAGNIAGSIAGNIAAPEESTVGNTMRDTAFGGTTGTGGGLFGGSGSGTGYFPGAPSAFSGRGNYSSPGGIAGYGSGKDASHSEANRGGGGVTSGGTGLW